MLITMQPKTSSAGEKSRDVVITEIADVLEEKTPDLFVFHEVLKQYPTMYTESMNTVLVQEIEKYNMLLELMKDNLKNVKLALAGEIGMSDELEDLGNSLFNGMVPELWKKNGFKTLKPLSSWTEDLIQRVIFMHEWIDNGTPCIFWLTKFIFPQAFITGTLQNYARKHSVAID